MRRQALARAFWDSNCGRTLRWSLLFAAILRPAGGAAAQSPRGESQRQKTPARRAGERPSRQAAANLPDKVEQVVPSWLAGASVGEPADAAYDKGRRIGNFNLRLPTAGGVQFWGDESCFWDWRIQRHALTGHCRLIDGANIRHAWGAFEDCERELARIRKRDALPAMSGRAIVVLHGLGGFTAVMAPLAHRLREESNCHVLNISYPSTQADLASHARGLASVLSHLEGVERIDLVAHSMGSVVVRYYLGEAERSGEGPDPRLGRIVMLAPLNRRSERATWWGKSRLVSSVLGKSFEQLGVDWPEISDKLGVPPCEFGIVAGGLQNGRGYCLTLEGDDDGVVPVEETRLAGASDFAIVPARHEALLIDREAHDCVARFLETGKFAKPDGPSPGVEAPQRDAR